MNDAITVQRKGSVAIVTIDRGEKKNALNQEMVLSLTKIARDFQDDHETTCVILRGAKDAFSAGIDLKDPSRWNIQDREFSERRAISQRGMKMCKAWEEMPQVTIAAIEGFNVGGGIALTLACDWRIMTTSSYLFVPELQIGIPLGWQTIPRLVRLVGPSKAKQVVFLGEKMTSEKALEWGLADFVVPDGESLEYAESLSLKISQMPSVAVRMTKQSIDVSANSLNNAVSFMDVDQAMLCGLSNEAVSARTKF